MSDKPAPPDLPKPAASVVEAVAPRWWKRRAVLLNALSALAGLPALVSTLQLIPDFHLPKQVAAWMLFVAAVAKWVSTQVGNTDAVEAAARAAEMGPPRDRVV